MNLFSQNPVGISSVGNILSQNIFTHEKYVWVCERCWLSKVILKVWVTYPEPGTWQLLWRVTSLW